MIISKASSFYRDAGDHEMGPGAGGERSMNKLRVEELLTETLGDQPMKPSQYKVLVVDDMAPMRDLIVTMLSRQGHQCITACNGLEALEKVEEEKIDAVVTDIVMPGMDGIALMQELSRKRYRLPIMVLTGHSKEYSEEAALAAGAREFIRKPFSVDEFILRFHRMMRDYEVLLQMEARTNRIIFNLQQEYTGKVNEAEGEAEKLRGRLCSSYMEYRDY